LKNFQSKYRKEGKIITKKQKLSIIIFIIVLISTLFIASIATYEKGSMYGKMLDGTYIIKTIETIQPFNLDYNYGVAASIWCMSLIIMLIILYICLKRKIKREYNMNITQKIILAITVPLIIFTIALGTGENVWFLWAILLIIVTIFEYDLFGNRKIISAIVNIDFKTFVKIGLVLIVLFFVIGILGYNIKPFFKVSSSRTTELIYNLHQKNDYSGSKFGFFLKEKPGNWLLNLVCLIMNK
jgi:magnesium-transporting ATPase (P-type)